MFCKLEDIEKIRYDRTESELQYFLMFAISVAGKRASQIIKSLNKFFEISLSKINKINVMPFESINQLDKCGQLDNSIAESKLGQHKKLGRAFRFLINSNIDLKKCDVEDLEKIPGVSFKTSRFFMSFNRIDVNYAVLDTHILAEMRDMGFDVPKSTPQNSKKYKEIESKFINYAHSIDMKPSELDLVIWSKRSKSLKEIK